SLAHRACSARLWHLREQYRAVLADLKDGALTLEAARDRRDALMATLQRIYEHAPPADREQYQTARQSLASLDEARLSDEEIDRFLPPTLKKAGSGTEVSAS
ncbi:MAG: SLATT domain-containing protein, partial [Vicinamibacterales bacterium]